MPFRPAEIQVGSKVDNADKSSTWTETVKRPEGIYTRQVKAEPWSFERTNCFCCSCPDYGGDPYCRNHGFAGTRPCLTHGSNGDADETGKMPEPVGKAPDAGVV